MSPDQVDEEDGSHQTVRKNCKFALKVEHDKEADEWRLTHVEGCSEHNHMPNTHSSLFLENKPLEPMLLDLGRFDITGIVRMGDMVDATSAGYRPTFRECGLQYHFMGTPDEGILELLETPYVRYRQFHGITFLAHMLGYRW